MKLSSLKPLVAVALVAASLGAGAAPVQGFYAGVSAGGPVYPDQVNGVPSNGSAVSGKLFAGYQVNQNFAVEAGVAELGNVSGSTGQLDGQSQFIDAVGMLPMSDQWSLLGRIGVAHVNLDTAPGSASNSGLKIGLGAQYSVTSNLAVRAEWERYQLSAFDDGAAKIDQYTVGLRVAF